MLFRLLVYSWMLCTRERLKYRCETDRFSSNLDNYLRFLLILYDEKCTQTKTILLMSTIQLSEQSKKQKSHILFENTPIIINHRLIRKMNLHRRMKQEERKRRSSD